jgi:hypothetical protein
MRIRKIAALALCFALLVILPLPTAAAGEEAIFRDLIAYYFHFREQASGEIENQLQTLSSLNPEEGERWRQLMDRWAWINEEMEVNAGVLPGGLPEDDSLCIVVLGYGLNGDGSMKEELIGRLQVALESAEKYPECYVLCTGGETARQKGVSEAGQMGNWLLSKGLAHNRLILEPNSLSTTENARNSLQLLWRDYPQVSSIALISSDYHIRWGAACFTAMNILHGGKTELAGNGSWGTDSPDRDTMYSQAWGISILADVPFDANYVPTLYMTEQPSAEESVPEPAPVSREAKAEKVRKEPVLPVLLGLAAVLAFIFIPKKRKTGSD